MKATLPEPEIVTRKGKPVSVILPIKHYEELLERLEDIEDIAWLKRARQKPLHYRPLEDYLATRKSKARVSDPAGTRRREKPAVHRRSATRLTESKIPAAQTGDY